MEFQESLSEHLLAPYERDDLSGGMESSESDVRLSDAVSGVPLGHDSTLSRVRNVESAILGIAKVLGHMQRVQSESSQAPVSSRGPGAADFRALAEPAEVHHRAQQGIETTLALLASHGVDRPIQSVQDFRRRCIPPVVHMSSEEGVKHIRFEEREPRHLQKRARTTRKRSRSPSPSDSESSSVSEDSDNHRPLRRKVWWKPKKWKKWKK